MISSGGNWAYLLLTVCFAAICITLYEPVMLWIYVLVICSVVMRTALFMRWQKHAPSVRTLNLLALLSGIVLAYFSWQLGLLLAMINLLVMACALKLMLLRSARDYYQLFVSAAFLLGCGFIFQQSILFAVIYAVLTGVLLVSLACYFSPSRALRQTLRSIVILSAQATPIALLLFIVLPQLAPLWQMPTSRTAQTGLSETVSPGDLANLSQSSALAFRASFDADKPAPRERYWRAIVLEEFDGKTWQVSAQRRLARRQYQTYNREFIPEVYGRAYTYSILAEPTHQRWLYALDVAVAVDPGPRNSIWQSQDYQLISSTPVVSTMQYRVNSYPDVALNQSLYSLDRRINLQLPERGNPQTRQWVASLKQQYPSDQALIGALLNHFRTQGYSYTLQPPVTPENPVDGFLFNTKAGFCAHYASAMAYALRLAGIPARMVTGYQGGEEHEGDFLSIYQYDAHAWVEAWFDDAGWRLFDPTAAVSPDRIEYGLERALAEEGSFLADAPFSLAKLKSIAWLNKLRLMLAEMDYLWSKWVLGFSNEDKLAMFKALLGKLTTERLAMLGVSVMLIIAGLLLVFYLPVWRQPKLPFYQRIYQQAERLLASIGHPRLDWQGPGAYMQAIDGHCPKSISVPFKRLSQQFIGFQYQSQSDSRAATRDQMKRDLTRLRLAVRQVRRDADAR